MKIQFKSDVKSPSVEIGEGEYRRTFKAVEQPFDVKEEEWALLAPTGLFEAAKEKTPAVVVQAPPPAAKPAGDSEQK
jgi:hypothetical protein